MRTATLMTVALCAGCSTDPGEHAGLLADAMTASPGGGHCQTSVLPWSVCFPEPGQRGYFRVDTQADGADVHPGDGKCRTSDGHCTLRAAVEESNALPGPGTIDLPAGRYDLFLNLLTITDHVRIVGAGAPDTEILNFGPPAPIFVEAGSLWLFDVTVFGSDGGTVNTSTDADAVVVRCVIASGGTGPTGNISAGRRFVVSESTISDYINEFGFGGGISTGPASTVVVGRSTIENNYSDVGGGGIYNDGELYVFDSTISGNTGGGGGAGGILNRGAADLRDVTITDNFSRRSFTTGRSAGGIINEGRLSMRNTLLAGNRGADGAFPDCDGSIRSRGHDLIGDPTGCTIVDGNDDRIGVAPGLAPLAFNGGPTRTHALTDGSPAIDAGPRKCERFDQRGVPRPQGRACDIGAYERIEHDCDDSSDHDGDHGHDGDGHGRDRHLRMPDCHAILPSYLWHFCPARTWASTAAEAVELRGDAM